MSMGREEKWIWPASLLATATLAWAIAFAMLTGFPGRPNGSTSLKIALAIIAVAGGIRFLRFIYRLWREGEPRPIRQIQIHFRPALFGFAPLLFGVAVIGLFLSSLTFLKSMIVAVVPFWADPPLADFDAAIGLSGEGLARALQPVIRELGLFYGLWHLVHLGSILWVLHWRAGPDKSRLIVGFMLTWGIGMVLAYVFSSAGPIFTDRFDLALATESVRRVSQFLWANYQQGTAVLGGGISAFPSMHVALAVWFALVLQSRGLGWLGWSYAFCVFACSVILGWHYSLDGVAGAAIAIAADRLARAWLKLGRTAILAGHPATATR